MLISAILVNIQEAQVLGSIWILTSMLIGGYYIDSENIPAFIRPLRYMSHIKVSSLLWEMKNIEANMICQYVYETLVRIELQGVIFECVPDGVAHTRYSQNGAICPVTEAAVLEGAQLDNISISGNIGILVAWIVILRALGYLALKFLNRRHKPKKKQKWMIKSCFS